MEIKSEEFNKNNEAQLYFDFEDETKSESSEEIHITSTKISEIPTVMTSDKEETVLIDLDDLRKALQSNCKYGEFKITVKGKEVSLLDKVMY